MKNLLFITLLMPFCYPFLNNHIIKFRVKNHNLLNNYKNLNDVNNTRKSTINDNNNVYKKPNVNNLFNNTLIKEKTDWDDGEVPWDVNSIIYNNLNN